MSTHSCLDFLFQGLHRPWRVQGGALGCLQESLPDGFLPDLPGSAKRLPESESDLESAARRQGNTG